MNTTPLREGSHGIRSLCEWRIVERAPLDRLVLEVRGVDYIAGAREMVAVGLRLWNYAVADSVGWVQARQAAEIHDGMVEDACARGTLLILMASQVRPLDKDELIPLLGSEHIAVREATYRLLGKLV